TATVTVTVTEPPNTAPEAQPDRTTTQQDTAVTLAQSALLGNDTDPEGDPLTLTEVGNPSNGNVELDADGNVIFTPDPGFTGIGTFEYTITDPSGNTSTTTVEVAVESSVTPPENQPPTAETDRVTTREDTPLSVPVAELTGNDTDPEGDPLTLTEVGN
ncbi:MAG: cadherin-like domain-containing protein, partial [Limnospira sp.]